MKNENILKDYQAKTISNFKAEIEGVIFNERQVFCIADELLYQFLENTISFNVLLIETLKDELEILFNEGEDLYKIYEENKDFLESNNLLVFDDFPNTNEVIKKLNPEVFNITKLKTDIIHEFLGNINNIRIDDKHIFYTTEFIMNFIIELGYKINEELIQNFASELERMYLKIENFSFADVETELKDKLIDNQKIEVYGERWFETTNEIFQNLNNKTT